jgi:uncharacterized membrane protein (UPF0127 family)
MRAFLLTGLIFILPLAGCGDTAKPAAPAPAPLAPADTRFALSVGGKTIRARVQLTELELATGLMNSTSLPEGEGMIFAYRDADRRAFWMANVPYDIDIGHFDSTGKLDEVLRLRANDTTPAPSKSESIRYALETPAGWFAAQGLKPGATLDLAALARAVESRGFRAKDFVTAP